MSEFVADNSDRELRPRFTIDPHGAYLTKLVDQQGRPIIFEWTEIDGKTRGGCHVCLPNFGPDASGVLRQHGFGRDVTWEVTREETAVTELTMPTEPGAYENLQAGLRYAYGTEGGSHLTMSLAMHNNGAEPLRVAPAFHPYFAVPSGESVRLNGQEIDIAQYADTEFIEGTTHELSIGERTLRLHSDQLTTWALWTDGKGDYFCVEPTLAGPSFQQEAPGDDELLAPGQLRTYEFRIYW